MYILDFFLLVLGAFLVSRLVQKRTPGPLPPGPRGLPLVGSVLDIPLTYQWYHFANWSQHWGDIMSFTMFGQSYVILNSARHAVDMLEKKSTVYSSRPRIPVAGDMIGWKDFMILQPGGHKLRETRKLLGLVMASTKRVERFHHLVEEETKQFLLGLSGCSNTLVRDIQKLAGSIIVMIAYGYKSTGDNDLIINTVDKAMEDFAIIFAPGAFLADIFPILTRVPSWFPGAAWKRNITEYARTVNDTVELPYRWVKEQMAAGTALPSFTSTLLEGNVDPGREHLVKMAATSLYAGGADTTVSSITSFFLAMSCFPEVQRKAQAELDAVIGPDRMPTIADRERLPYLNAVMLEILRWIPVAPMGFPHQLTEDDVHAGYFIPKGTLVMVNIWNLLHDPQTYTDPMTFNPDRFITTPEWEAERDPRDFAFGFGRRRCPGIFFAEASIFAACSMSLQLYTISKAVDEKGNTIGPPMEGSGTLISHPLPFKCNITVRSDKARVLLDSLESESTQV
ncbi:cytochrome P450 [Lentinus tigrinus ALCF2SS1-7]|uniref:Cytochrome P450 n=1 Tax=Lentinus tigrinus ALCF2SS1-6 TaxID=1328759 RepID=A0A5C2STG6_9APHY|nr:cytochrome P450 [Lentinus tigrinus ALCF2SS1-6]RPD80607.1 cytochrome P450 [Lentinus tigrinus ALCF2SS1-7]